MLKNYFKIAIRNLARQKGLAFINIFGLSAGLACFSLFLLYALNEFSFDNFHKNEKNLYRMYIWQQAKGSEPANGVSYHPYPLGPALKQEFPDVEDYIRVREGWGESFIKSGNDVFRESVTFADPSFFTAFSFKLLSGNPAHVLNDLHSMVVTETTAKKFFGKEDPVGKTILVKTEDNFEPFTITGVAENPPSNSTIQFQILANFRYLESLPSNAKTINNWHRISIQTYVLLKPGSLMARDNNHLIAFRKKYYPEEEAKSRADGWTGKGPLTTFRMQPIRDMHTNTAIQGGSIAPADPKTTWILLWIACGILLIACINFTTLANGRSASRAKEVGVRKVIGGTRKSLVYQFLTEAFLLTVISGLLGFFLAKLLIGPFNTLSGKNVQFSFQHYPQLGWMIAGLILLTAFLAGLYPALVLSGFKPVEVLKTKVKIGGANIFTKSLVTLQFILSAGLIISTIVILQQLHYLQTRSPGFNKENVLVIDANGISETGPLYTRLKQELRSSPGIISTASAELGLGENTGWSQSGFKYNGKDKSVYEYFVDHDYLTTLGLTLIAGRNFDPTITSDTVTSVIINESMMRDFGWTLANAVGQPLTGYNEKFTPVVIGVVKNYNFFAFREEIKPQMFHQFSSYQPYNYFIRIKPGDPSGSLAAIRAAWKKTAPDYPLKYSFLDENLGRFYQSEQRWGTIVGWAGGISIFLACLGLLGLAALTAVNRTKEIGVRKVLGAGIPDIVKLLSRDFGILVLIALVIAAPIAWYFMHAWLNDYPYRIALHWWVFGIAALAVILTALATVSVQALKAAMANPVKSLRSE